MNSKNINQKQNIIMSQEERDRETAQKVVNIFLRKMNVTVNETVTENLLEQFKEDFIKKLVERKPLAFLCDHAPDALFFQGLRGLKELAPFFSFKLSMIIFWKTGSICVNYFNWFPQTSLKRWVTLCACLSKWLQKQKS